MSTAEYVTRVQALLRRIEWMGDEYDDNCCPECRAEQHVEGSHRPGCELAALMEGRDLT